MTYSFDDAHIPSLIMSLVHLTGDSEWITGPRPEYDFFGDGQGALPDHFVADAKAAAEKAMAAHQAGAPLPPQPDAETITNMMRWIAGTQAEVPDHYIPLLREELGLSDGDAKAPQPAAVPKRVAVIGAGMSGLLAAIRLKQAGHNVTIIEKNADVGGTWFENTYPGVRVDTPNHLYSYSFEPNHEWPQHYSTGDVLLAYFQGVADRYSLRDHIRFETVVETCRWDDAQATWTLDLSCGEPLTVDAVVSAVGQLNKPRLPDIPGIDDFTGDSFHSARWPKGFDPKGRKVAVVGTGASAFQFVPEIAADTEQLTVFQRTPPWLGPTENYHDKVTDGKNWLIEHLPFYDRWYRFWLFWMLTDGILGAVTAEEGYEGKDGTISPINAELRAALVGELEKQVEDQPELLSSIVPTYPIGGKRSLRDNGVWVSALKRDNVDLVETPIARVTKDGVETEDGQTHSADTIIYGTGFTASDFLSGIDVIGTGGAKLHDRWQGNARAYLGMTVPDFPNFFMIYGPNTNIVVNGSIIFFSECAVRYITGALDMLGQRGQTAMQVRGDVHDELNVRIDAENARMAWGHPDVSSWYKNAHGRVSQNWPFPLVDYWRATLAPDPDDYKFSGGAPARQAAE